MKKNFFFTYKMSNHLFKLMISSFKRRLNNNQLTGETPKELSNLSNLIHL